MDKPEAVPHPAGYDHMGHVKTLDAGGYTQDIPVTDAGFHPGKPVEGYKPGHTLTDFLFDQGHLPYQGRVLLQHRITVGMGAHEIDLVGNHQVGELLRETLHHFPGIVVINPVAEIVQT